MDKCTLDNRITKQYLAKSKPSDKPESKPDETGDNDAFAIKPFTLLA